ncbi:MAG: 6-phosphogluconolactonase [Microcoleaceae cyanobacterium]
MPTQTVVKVFPDLPQLIDEALTICLVKMQGAIATRGIFTIALAGGITPKPLYEAIARQSLDWEKIHVFWGDERYVPADHPDSNEGMARKAWLDQVAIPASNIHPMPTLTNNPVVDADTYHQTIEKFFTSENYAIPQFDLILLGMGDDGHTASLFPHTPALQVEDRLVTVGEKDEQPRLTFTKNLINQAHCVMFLVAGASKQPALDQVLSNQGDNATYPSRLIQPAGELYWLLTGLQVD